jgi:hypothetical protein
VDIASREAFLAASRSDFVEIKELSKSRFPEVVWLGEVPPSPENWNRLSAKAASVPAHRGILIAARGPGVRVPPEQFTGYCEMLLNDGSAAGAAAVKDAVQRATVVPFLISQVPSDLSKAGLQRLLAQKMTTVDGQPWVVVATTSRMSKQPGVKPWKVLAPPNAIPKEEQLPFRGSLLLTGKWVPPTPRASLVRQPRADRKRGKGHGKGDGKPTVQQPKWIAGCGGAQVGPDWAQRSWANVVQGKKEENVAENKEDQMWDDEDEFGPDGVTVAGDDSNGAAAAQQFFGSE